MTFLTIEDLPDEILLKIFTDWISHDEVLKLARVNKRWSEISETSSLWKVMTQRKYPYYFSRDASKVLDTEDSFLDYFKSRSAITRRLKQGKATSAFTVPLKLQSTTGRYFGAQLLDPFRHFGDKNLPMHALGAGEDSGLRIFNLETKDCVLTEKFSTNGLFDVVADCYTPGRFVASSFEGSCYLFDIIPPAKDDDANHLKPKELKELLHKNGFTSSDCFEKSELVAKVKRLGLDKPRWKIERIAECGNHFQPAVTARSYGDWLVSCGFDGCVKLFDTTEVGRNNFKKLEAKYTFSLSRQGPVPVNCIVMNRSQGKLVIGSNDATISVINLEGSKQSIAGHGSNGNVAHLPVVDKVLDGHDHWVWSLQSWNPNDDEDLTTLVSGSVDRTVRMWDIRQHHSLISTLEGFRGPVPGLKVYGDYLFVGSFDGLIRVFDRRMLPGSGRGLEKALISSFDTLHQNMARIDGNDEYIVGACQHSDVHVFKFI